MVLTPSTMVKLGTPIPEFSLPDTSGNLVSLEDFSGAPGLLVIFLCNHCPYVKHIRTTLAEVTATFLEEGLKVVGINSNDVVEYPEDSPQRMAEEKRKFGYQFPYLFDETQSVAKSFGASCTPDFFLYDSKLKLCYRGQFDESRPGNKLRVTGEDLCQAVEALLAGKSPSEDQRPSIGCNIKWKASA